MNMSIFRARQAGEVAVIGLGRSGSAVAELLVRDGHKVYASDASDSPEASTTGARLRELGVHVDTGGHDLARIAAAALVVTSPGVPPSAAPLVAARQGGRDIVGEIEIALHYLPDLRYIAVSGTNGKTTTTALIGCLLRALGHDAPDAGNIGTPLASLALRTQPPAWAALELSSFQLHDTPSLRPTVSVLTNLSPDHLDRYASVTDYYADKARLFANADETSAIVANADDAAVLEMAAAHAGTRWRFSAVGAPVEARYDRNSGLLELLGRTFMPRVALPLMGDHNVANALAATLAVAMADGAHRTDDARLAMADALRSFQALPHRMEPVGEVDDVLWINDSKATNISSTRVALEGMRRPYVLLLGGRHKGEPYTSLVEPFKQFGRAVLAFGEARDEIVHDLGDLLPVERLDGDFQTVVARARSLANPGDAILLSPACSSYDMFHDYEQRGETFRELAGGPGR